MSESLTVDPRRISQSRTTGLLERFRTIRGVTHWLAESLDAEDCVVQSMPDASPVKWHLAHTTWFFETFVLEPTVAGHRPFDESFRVLYNSYYNTVGEQHPRPDRGMVTRPSLQRVLEYREFVNRSMERIFEEGLAEEKADVIEIGLQHEQQHQELILTDVKHLFSQNPIAPVYRSRDQIPAVSVPTLGFTGHDEGLREIGHVADGFAYDNEHPRHRRFVEAFEIATRLVTNEEFLAFIDDGGYRRAELWLSDGWDAVRRNGWQAPLYWSQDESGQRSQFTLSGRRSLLDCEPVTHVSFFEADAYARWAGARLPTECEWEVAAEEAPLDGNFLESGKFHPEAARSDGPAAEQFFGDVWEWTASPYTAYPGYRPLSGALGEYNGKFMCDQWVLRGGSCATSKSHIRATYRNFFPASARWQFSGIRLAR